MNEHGYVKSVHRQIPKSTYVWKINDNYAGGVADAFYCDSGGQLFVEYKYVPKVPKRATTMLVPALSELQKHWLRERHRQNVAVAVVLGTPLGGIVFTDLAWEEGLPRVDLEQFALPPKGVAHVILDHCEGRKSVYTSEQTYSNTARSREGQAA